MNNHAVRIIDFEEPGLGLNLDLVGTHHSCILEQNRKVWDKLCILLVVASITNLNVCSTGENVKLLAILALTQLTLTDCSEEQTGKLVISKLKS